jgi:hypothetical protein
MLLAQERKTMAIIITKSQNFHPGSVVSQVARDNDNGMSKGSPDNGAFGGLSGVTALSTSYPGFGSRSAGRFNVSDFLG